MKAMAHEEHRLYKRENVADSKSLSTMLFSSTNSNACKLKNISEGGILVSCKKNIPLYNNVFNGVFKYEENDVVYSFIVEMRWKKKVENEEILMGLKFHLKNDNILTIIRWVIVSIKLITWKLLYIG